MKQVNKTVALTLGGSILLIGLVLINLLVGMSEIGIQDILSAFFNYNGSKNHLVIRTLRVPRILLCILVGGSMAMAGLVIQNITRNPLASPQVLGINAGASLSVVTLLIFFPQVSYSNRILFAFIGASIIGGLVYVLGRLKDLSPLKVTLVGISIQLFLSSITRALMLVNESKTTELVFWMMGAVHHAQPLQVQVMLPWFIAAVCLGLVIGHHMDVLRLGEQMAASLGGSVKLSKLIGVAIVILLAGSAVAVAGPISFIGLITPHIVKQFGISTFRSNFILCGIYGANLLVASDILAKCLNFPYESPVGIVTAFLGAIFYMLLARKQMK